MYRNKVILVLAVLFMTAFWGMADTPVNDGAKQKKGVILKNWEISRLFDAVQINRDMYPHFYVIFMSGWHKIEPDDSGVLNIEKTILPGYHIPASPLIFGRTVFQWDKKETITFFPEFLGDGVIFFNGQKMAEEQDHSLSVTAEKGLNEIFFMITKNKDAAGWGFKCSADRVLVPPATDFSRLTKVWETGTVFLTPESVLYDEKRDILYVTSFDNRYNPTNTDETLFTGFISKVKVSGEIENLHWITKLNAPCGVCIYKDRLYTVERGFLTEIDINEGKILKRYRIEGSEFLNDIIVDDNGYIYMSDTSPSAPIKSRIYRFREGKSELWEGSDAIYRANGLFIYNKGLLVGNSGDGFLKSIALKDKKITAVISLGAGIIDGIRVDNKGNFLVSHWEGLVYLISPEGKVIKILDTLKDMVNTADFEFIKKKNLLIIPTFMGNKIVAYRLN